MYVIVTNEYWPDTGGVGRYTYTLSHSLASDADVNVVTHKSHAKTISGSHSIDPLFERRMTKPINYVKNVVAMRRYISHYKNKIFIYADYGSILIGILASLLFKYKYAVIFHGSEINRLYHIKNKSFLGGYFIDKFLISSSKIVCISNVVKDLFIDKFVGISRDVDIAVIYNALDQAFISNVASMDYDNTGGVSIGINDKINILTVGRLDYRKRVDLLVRSLHLVDRDWKLNIVGAGPTDQLLKDLVDELSLSSRVIFHGRVSDKKLFSLYSGTNLYVACSGRYKDTIEGFGLTIIEAASLGVPVLAFDIDGAGEVSRIIKSNLVNSTVEEISHFINNFHSGLSAQWSPNRIVDNFNPTVQSNQFVDLLKDV